jgi:hypothetical protein
MSEIKVRAKLEELGRWTTGSKLEPWELLVQQAPAKALDAIETYRLIDADATPARDSAARNWTPVAVLDGEVLIDPSPEMFDGFLRSVGYFDAPDKFGEQLLLQFHRFSLDFYEGFRVREEAFDFADGALTVRGMASRGAGRQASAQPFETIATRKGHATFVVQESDDDNPDS